MAVRNKFTWSFEVTNKNHDTTGIVAVNVWNEKTHFKIQRIYSPPDNKNLNLDLLIPNRKTIFVGDFNPASSSWGYTYQNQVGLIVKDFVDSKAMFIAYEKHDPNTFIHSSGNSDLTMVSS